MTAYFTQDGQTVTTKTPHKTTPKGSSHSTPKGGPKMSKGTEKDQILNSAQGAQLDQALQHIAQNHQNPNQSGQPVGGALPQVGGAHPPGFQDRTNDKFQKECLTATNVYRKKHHAGPLQIEPQVHFVIFKSN